MYNITQKQLKCNTYFKDMVQFFHILRWKRIILPKKAPAPSEMRYGSFCSSLYIGSVAFKDIFYVLHTAVPLSTLVSALFQVIGEQVQLVWGQVLFVAQLMLKACPEVHGDGAELHLSLHKALLVLKENGHSHDKVETSVPVGLGVLYVVLFLDESNVVLLKEAVGEAVDVLDEGTDYPYAGNIAYITLDSFHIPRDMPGQYLAEDTGVALDPGLNEFNGVALAVEGELLIEYAEFGLDLHNCALVICEELLHGDHIALDGLKELSL